MAASIGTSRKKVQRALRWSGVAVATAVALFFFIAVPITEARMTE
jgi:hypothetical protein